MFTDMYSFRVVSGTGYVKMGNLKGISGHVCTMGGREVCDLRSSSSGQEIVFEPYDLLFQRGCMKHTRSLDFIIAHKEKGDKAFTVVTDKRPH